MEIYQGIAHTAEIKLEFDKEYFKRNVRSCDFERADKRKGKYRHQIQGFNTTVIFRNAFWLVAYIKVDFHELLKGKYADENTSEEICIKIDEYITKFFGSGITTSKLIRFDYSVDIKADSLTRQTILQTLSTKTFNATKYYKRDARFQGSIYYNNVRKKKCSATNQPVVRKFAKKMLIYDKENKELAVSMYKDVLRFEVVFQREALRYNKSYYKLEANLFNYLNSERARYFIVKEYKKILFSGDFYRIDVANEIIKRSNLTWDMKRRLIAFINIVNAEGIDHVRTLSQIKKNSKSKSITETLTKDKYRSYIQKLEMLDLNPITLMHRSELIRVTNPIKLFESL